MLEIKDLLNKWDSILLSEEGKKQVIAGAIKEITGVEIETDDVKIQNGTLFLNIKPIYKNEVFLKKEKILTKIKEVLGKKSPDSIR